MKTMICPYCHGSMVFRSRFRWIDWLALPFGLPLRCLGCHERFYGWVKCQPQHLSPVDLSPTTD